MHESPRRTIKDLLAEAKDTSELMVDLAYAAVFFADTKLAEEVDRLEELMDEYIHDLRLRSMLAARSPEDAEAFTAVLHIASCTEKIADAAVDIARVVSDVVGIPDALRSDLRHADEISGRVRVRRGSTMVGHSLRDAALPTETGMWVIAIRSGTEWEYDPGPETVIGTDDVLVFRGPEEGVSLIRKLAGAESADRRSEVEPTAWPELDRAVDILVALKNTAEVSVGMAYSSLLLREPALAAEVTALESRSDELHGELESWVLRATEGAPNPEELRGLLRLGFASEVICDAARDLTRLVELGEELHPVVADALEASDAVAVEAIVAEGSPSDGRSLKELSFKTETGMVALAVQRGGRWIYRPPARFVLRAGDRVIATGPEDGIEELDALARAPEPAEA